LAPFDRPARPRNVSHPPRRLRGCASTDNEHAATGFAPQLPPRLLADKDLRHCRAL